MRLPKNTIIALAGPAGCGKDTIADWLVAQHDFTKLAFADAVREEVVAAFGIHPELLTERATKEIPTKMLSLSRCADYQFVERMLSLELEIETASDDEITAHHRQPRSPRWALQHWGTEYRRDMFGDDYWITELAQRMAAIDTPVVITDCRFEGEAQFVSLHGGEIWQIYRPDVKAVASHSSEHPISPEYIDRLIENRTDVNDLLNNVDTAIMMMKRAQLGAA